MHGVFLDLQTFRDNIDVSALDKQLDTLTCYGTTSAQDVVTRAHNADVIITNKVNLNANLLTKLPNLKLICIAATGTNNVDLEAAKKQGIAVCNVSGYSTPSVSQYVFAQLLEYFNHTSHHNNNTATGQWQNSPTFCFLGKGFTELSTKKLGIVGYGDIGQAVANIAKAFGMTVLIAERPNATTIRSGRIALEDMLKQADIISLHCPQTPETENLINVNTLNIMKKDAVLINTSRGPVVDSQALHHALINKKIAYAILDVLEQEPPPKNHILLGGTNTADKTPLPNLKLTAHIAWASDQAQDRLIRLIGDNIDRFKQGAITH